MGTRFELVLAAERGSPVEAAHLRAAGEQALEEIAEQHRRLSYFEPASLLSRLNRRGAAGWVELDLDTFELLADAREIWRASGGAFDPSVAPLMEALGLRGDADAGYTGAEHTDVELAAARAAMGLAALELDGPRQAARFLRPDLRLDLGAIAKGHALDLAAAALHAAGVERALLHGGTSSVVALGAPPGADAWRVSLAGVPDLACALADATLSVSAPHGRTAPAGGHVLDPRTARPAAALALAAVAAPLTPGAARRADAWSTALVAGAPDPNGPGATGCVWLRLARAEGAAPRTGGTPSPAARFERT